MKKFGLKSLLTCTALASVSFLSAPKAEAVLIPPVKEWFSIPGTTLAAHPYLAGTVIQDVLRPFQAAIGGQIFSGHVEDRIVRESGTGQLDFYYRIVFDVQPTIPMSWMEVIRGPLEKTTLDTDTRLDGLGTCMPDEVYNASGSLWYAYHTLSAGDGASTRFTYVRSGALSYNARGSMQVSGFYGPYYYSVTLPCFEPAY